MKTAVLERIVCPADIQNLSIKEMEILAEELRELIISTISKTGGHLAPSLGVVELTLAILNLFNPDKDKIIWDVGHQAYAYKILTKRRELFSTIRQYQGLSGFPSPKESGYDHFGVGHSSTSISAGLGQAVARDLLGRNHKVLAVIGDGSMTAGLAYEGLNQAGGLDKDLVVVLNDNEMSISKNVGALSSFFSRKLADQRYLRFREDLKSWLEQVPRIGEELVNYARKSEDSLKSFFTAGMLFEAFKFTYVGPINGHNLRQLLKVFEQVRNLKGPVLIHTLTTKGKGYQPAEKNPTFYHGVGSFKPETGERWKKKSDLLPNYSKVFGESLCRLARERKDILAISAAMPEGTGLDCFREEFPDRFFDVGICEQHAVTFAAGLATQGFKPVVAIYSTFLQRSFDQLIHDVCLQELPVTFCLDRGGLVGEDGATHHGAFDLSYLRLIPNLTLMAPKDEPELQAMLLTALSLPGPAAIRYPRGRGPGLALSQNPHSLEIGRGELLRPGNEAMILAAGSLVTPALRAAEEMEQESPSSIGVINARFIKPLPEKEILDAVQSCSKLMILEENALAGGFGSAVLEYLNDHALTSGLTVKRIGLPDRFIEHGQVSRLHQLIGLDVPGIKEALRELLD
ncbi:MAG: 1-deoxy-D-xylulose-5-phosphate synthase [Desulfohalobiaceae bacterium]|nr:1-deoxy-D-xylulose-5-phosphate synthase [Desulfohalobiaceae bacterium]